MIRVIMLDLGNTLVRESDRTLFPHVTEALRTLGSFTNDDGAALPLCLVSNFPGQLPVVASQLPQVFKSFLQILDEAGLTSFFQPVAERVTISAHVGIAKPDAAFFSKALERLKLAAGFDACLLITEDAGHIAHVRSLGMHALQFGGQQTPSPPGADFTDWAEAPLLIARSEFTNDSDVLKLALRGFLEATQRLVVSSIQGSGTHFEAAASARVPMPADAIKSLTGVLVDVPVHVRIKLDDRGRPVQVVGAEPSADNIAEVCANIESLASNGQIAGIGNSAMGPTHQIDVDASGARTLKRKRYTAF